MRLGVLVSGRGSNLEAVLTAKPPGVEPVLVVSNRPGVRALEVAAAHGVPTRVLRRGDHGGDPSARDGAIGEAFEHAGVELVLLAGYDQLLRPSYFAAYSRSHHQHPSQPPSRSRRGRHDGDGGALARCSPPVTRRRA